MLTLISFSLLLLQSSLDELFNPRLRRGKIEAQAGHRLEVRDPGRRRSVPVAHRRRGRRRSGTDRGQQGGRRLMAKLLDAENIRGVYYTPDGR